MSYGVLVILRRYGPKRCREEFLHNPRFIEALAERLYESLEPSERRLWHSHVFEVKSGTLIMPKPDVIAKAAWKYAENKEMEQVIKLYGGVYQFCTPGFWEKVAARDERLKADYERKQQSRQLWVCS
ncbi:hypothetical protein BJ165DRAFT_1410813 [Panaeolus papilionaceus]|nr:hypothetical protein BJ165DRAFT_1410813 [Panaeolus papilionaceus]